MATLWSYKVLSLSGDGGVWTVLADGENQVVVENLGPETVYLDTSSNEDPLPPIYGEANGEVVALFAGKTSPLITVPSGKSLWAATSGGYSFVNVYSTS